MVGTLPKSQGEDGGSRCNAAHSSYDEGMAILVWTLGLPTVATAIAIVWVHVASRPRGPVETHESVAAHERFKAAFAPSSTQQRRAG